MTWAVWNIVWLGNCWFVEVAIISILIIEIYVIVYALEKKDRNAFRNFVGKTSRKRPLRRSRSKSEDNIKTRLRQGYYENGMLKVLAHNIPGTDSTELSGSVITDE
jgi:uncharacterized protein YxeA